MALAIVVFERPAEVREAVASAIHLGFDQLVVLDNGSQPPVPAIGGVDWIRDERNTGVTAARNRLVASTDCDLVCFLDDDAVLATPDTVERLREAFADPELGAIAFLIERPGGVIEPSEWPFRGSPDRDKSGPAAYFVGAGHAVRRSAWLAVGGLDESFVYSTEEIDLSMALLRDGWQIRFDPGLAVVHRPSMHGRSIAPTVPALRFRNRIVYARRHLPWAIAIVHILAWAVRTGCEALAAGHMGPWFRAGPEGCRLPIQRRPLSWSKLRRIHSLGGRVFW